jgi:N-acetylglucosamine-6-phosphate deacetylase
MLDRAVRNVVGLGCGLTEALLAVTRVPAEVLGRNDLGRLEVGAPADLVWWSDDLVPLRTWVGGTQAYDSEWTVVPE